MRRRRAKSCACVSGDLGEAKVQQGAPLVFSVG
jgi:hypothetical protein